MLATPTFIKVPSVYMVKLPCGWLNLAQVRQVKLGDRPGKIIVIWDTGEPDYFMGHNAQVLLDVLAETTQIDGSKVR